MLECVCLLSLMSIHLILKQAWCSHASETLNGFMLIFGYTFVG